MKVKQKLTTGITLVNKKYKKDELYHYIVEPSNVILLPIIRKLFLIVEQKRIPINKKNFEFPSGWIDKGEKPVKAAKRELFEETGYMSVDNPLELAEFFADPGRGTRSCFCFVSKKIIKKKLPEKDINIFFKTEKQIKKLIKQKKFNNASHIAAFYCFLNKN
tara:strand:+ start:814 stop:1299 length:486 start_codon:yes stop_codon:yes gene_type:complete